MSKSNKNKFRQLSSTSSNSETESSTYSNDDSDSETKFNIADHLAIFLKHLLSNTKIKTSASSDDESIEEPDISIILDRNGIYWYNAIQIANLLEYINPKDAIKKYVKHQYKKYLTEISVKVTNFKLTNPKIIYVNDCGFIQLISHSRKKECVKLWKSISVEILPTLFKLGYCEMPIKDNYDLIETIYSDKALIRHMSEPCIYLAYVGKHTITVNGTEIKIDVLKYDIAKNITKDDIDNYRNFYGTFNVLEIWRTSYSEVVKNIVRSVFMSIGTIVKPNFNHSYSPFPIYDNEYVYLTQLHNSDFYLDSISNIILQVTKSLNNSHNNNYVSVLEHKIKLLESENAHLTKMNNLLKSNIDVLHNNKISDKLRKKNHK